MTSLVSIEYVFAYHSNKMEENLLDRIAINKRFFHTLDVLRQMREIRGLKTFVDAHHLNYWNMVTLKKEPNRFLHPEYLKWLVEDYDVSAEYLLTGKGCMFNYNKSRAL